VTRQFSVSLLCFGLTAYFAYHAIYGRHGFETHQRLIARSEILEFEVKGLETVRAKLERDVALLAADLPHPDLVEETARDVLGLARRGDRLLD
jgi:cell division protein FtsB